ncbi:MAG: glycosyltransferase family 39 protein [Acidobacteriota bacterium]
MVAGSPNGFPRAFVVGAVLVGLVVRLAFGLWYWNGQALTRDELEYLSLARSLAAGHGFVYDEVLRAGSFTPFGRSPGYPAFLALIGAGSRVFTSAPTAVKVAQSFVGAIGVWLAAIVAFRVGGTRAARAGAAIAAVYPPLVWIAAFVWSESIFWPLGLFIAWLFDRAVARGGRALGGFVCGVVVGLAIITRPAIILFLPLAGIYLIWKRHPRMLAAMAVGVLLVYLPWTARNYLFHGRVMVVASDGGVTFWTGNHPLAIGEGDMAANSALKLDNQRLRAKHPGLTEEEMEHFYYEEAFSWMRAHPLAWMTLELKKAFYLVVPIGPSYTLHSVRYFVTSVVSYGTLLGLGFVAIARRRFRLGDAAGVWLLAGSAVLVCLVFFPQERFRIPLIDPALVVLGGLGIATLFPSTSRP